MPQCKRELLPIGEAMNKETRTTANIVFLFPPQGDLGKLWGAATAEKPLTLMLARLGYVLAKGRGHKFCLVDHFDAHELTSATDVDEAFAKKFHLAAIDAGQLPTVTQARAMLRKAGRKNKKDSAPAAPARKPEIPIGERSVSHATLVARPSAPTAARPASARNISTRFDRAFRTYPFTPAEPLRIVERAPPASAALIPPSEKLSSWWPEPTASSAPPAIVGAPAAPAPALANLPPALLQQRTEMAERLARSKGYKVQVQAAPITPSPPEINQHKPPMFARTVKAGLPAPSHALPDLKPPRTVWVPHKGTEEFLERWVAEQANPNLNGERRRAQKG